MSNISDLEVSESRNSVTWVNGVNRIQIELESCGQAIEDPLHNTVVISLLKGKYPYKIKVFDFSGDERLTLKEPDRFEFYYMKKHSIYGVSIICTTNEPVDGRMDWQFAIDYEIGRLDRVSPSY